MLHRKSPIGRFPPPRGSTLSGSHAPAWEQVSTLQRQEAPRKVVEGHRRSQDRAAGAAKTAFPRWTVGTRTVRSAGICSRAERGSHGEARRVTDSVPQLVPTLCVGMQSSPLRGAKAPRAAPRLFVSEAITSRTAPNAER